MGMVLGAARALVAASTREAIWAVHFILKEERRIQRLWNKSFGALWSKLKECWRHPGLQKNESLVVEKKRERGKCCIEMDVQKKASVEFIKEIPS